MNSDHTRRKRNNANPVTQRLIVHETFSDSIQLQVVPLNRGSLDWDEPFIAANLSSRINACRIGCQDLESVNSTCAARCNSLIAPDSCQQGCRAIADILLHHIQGR
ncbi:unnamed protein product [Anisakis simplex]|uniref:Roller-3 N-terminal domain-containing protein n=1 Tax=Anisakis simplex TaxID=6269 RepID=A0A0M3K4X1_ANISI|nr:unnamed protein product [Anisakis simplex]